MKYFLSITTTLTLCSGLYAENLEGWSSISGMTGDVNDATILYSINDDFYKTAYIYRIDVSDVPARITAARKIKAKNLDLEGIAQDTDGSFWLASEGKPAKKKKPEVRKNRILHVDAKGELIEEVMLPAALLSKVKRFGLEGITLDGDKVLVAFQRGWKDDPKHTTKIGEYNRKTQSWGFYHYPLDKPQSSKKSKVGLSEISTLAPNQYLLIERDNRQGAHAAIKRVYRINTQGIQAGTLGSKLPKLKKTLLRDLLADARATKHWTPDKIEGLAVTKDKRIFLAIDNDGEKIRAGQTLLWEMKN